MTPELEAKLKALLLLVQRHGLKVNQLSPEDMPLGSEAIPGRGTRPIPKREPKRKKLTFHTPDSTPQKPGDIVANDPRAIVPYNPDEGALARRETGLVKGGPVPTTEPPRRPRRVRNTAGQGLARSSGSPPGGIGQAPIGSVAGGGGVGSGGGPPLYPQTLPPGKAPGFLSRVGGAYARAFKAAPFNTVVGTLGAGAYLTDALIQGYPEIAAQVSGNRYSQSIQDAANFQLEAARQQAKIERLQQTMALNTARLAQAEPHLYNEVLAGRRLPQGAVVLGGNPRTDLLSEMALRMSTGGFQQTSAQDELAGMLQ